MRTEFTASVMSVPVSHPFVISSHVSAVPNWEGMQSNAFMKPNTNLVPRDKPQRRCTSPDAWRGLLDSPRGLGGRG